MTSNILLNIIVPIITAIITAIITYLVTRKGKIDDITIKRGLEIAEKISILIQNIIEDEDYFYKTYEGNYSHYLNMEGAIENFKRMKSLFSPDYARIEKHADNKRQLIDNLKIARLYLNKKIIKQMQEYIDIGHFTFEHDGFGMVNTYYLDFFKNIMNATNKQNRLQLAESIKLNLYKLLK